MSSSIEQLGLVTLSVVMLHFQMSTSSASAATSTDYPADRCAALLNGLFDAQLLLTDCPVACGIRRLGCGAGIALPMLDLDHLVDSDSVGLFEMTNRGVRGTSMT